MSPGSPMWQCDLYHFMRTLQSCCVHQQWQDHTVKNDVIPAVPEAAVAHFFVFLHCDVCESPVYTLRFDSFHFLFKSANFLIELHQGQLMIWQLTILSGMTWEQRWGGKKTEYCVCIALMALRVLSSSESTMVWLSDSQYSELSESFSCCSTGCPKWDVPFGHCSLAFNDDLLTQGITQTRCQVAALLFWKIFCAQDLKQAPKNE